MRLNQQLRHLIICIKVPLRKATKIDEYLQPFYARQRKIGLRVLQVPGERTARQTG